MIRIGIVGCGRILAAHLRGYRALRAAGVDNFRITALCARRLDDARMYAVRGSGPAQRPAASTAPGDPLAVGDEYVSDFQDDVEVALFDDYREMIRSGPVDAINDFTAHGLHHLVADAACRAGRHLLTQKPLAVTVAAARAMCDQFEAAGLILGVFENWRFRDKARYLRWFIDQGRLGTPQMFLFGNVGNWWAPDRVVAHTPWRHDRKRAGGIALDLGVHQFHLARHLLGPIESVQASTGVVERQRYLETAPGQREAVACDADDIFSASFTSHGGAFGTITASWAGHGGGTIFGGVPVLYGTRGRVVGTTFHADGGETLDIGDLYWRECDPTRREAEFPSGLRDEFGLAQLDWLRAIAESRPPETSGREGLADLACAYAILESDLAGRRIPVDEVARGALCAYQQPIAEHFGLLPASSPR